VKLGWLYPPDTVAQELVVTKEVEGVFAVLVLAVVVVTR
jgi:hypothetical protein